MIFFWTAIEIYQSRLRFHFRDTILDATNTVLNASTWYHVEYQYVDSTILVSINDCQYVTTVNDTLNTYDLSNIQLYLGGLPVTSSLMSGLYPSLTQVNTFSGCIRNVLSNGHYLDMSKALVSVNSYYGQSSCTLTNPYTTPPTSITITTTTTTPRPTTTATAGRSAHFATFRFIWNKIDQDISNAKQGSHPPFDEQAILEKVRADCLAQLPQQSRPQNVYLCSSRLKCLHRWDMDDFMHDLCQACPQLKRESFLFSINAHCREALRLKVEYLRKRQWFVCSATGATAILHVPGLSQSINLIACLNEAKEYRQQLGLCNEAIERLKILQATSPEYIR
ncbi:unnamed protein product, partial [Rotaria sp. Silwood1]